MNQHLLLRADASAAIGTGHVMRCLALAQAWQDAGGRATFASAELPAALAARLERERVPVERIEAAVGSESDATALVRLAQQAGATVVVDGYRFTAGYLETLRAAGVCVLVIDDMAHLPNYPVDLLLNQNLGATPDLYRGKSAPETELLLGPAYSLLRREFRRAIPVRASLAGRPRRVLVTFGGSDPENCTAAVLAHLSRQPASLEVRVLAGAANPHLSSLQATAARAPFPCEVKVNVENVADSMVWADVAITAGGSTVWELAAMRLPALVVAITADQRFIGPALRQVGSFRSLAMDELLGRDLSADIDALLAIPPDFGGLDASGAGRVTGVLHRHFSRCVSVP